MKFWKQKKIKCNNSYMKNNKNLYKCNKIFKKSLTRKMMIYKINYN